MELKALYPKQIVEELDRYVISQDEAKKAVALAMRNRWRRIQVSQPLRDEITPKNIIMIGPTGVGKTEISRRLAKLANAPFVKVEASKFTEVGYVGRDVESIVRDLVETSFRIVKEEEKKKLHEKALQLVEERLLDLLLPPATAEEGAPETTEVESDNADEKSSSTREKLRKMLQEEKLEERVVEFEVAKAVSTHLEVMGPHGFSEVEGQIKEALSNMMPKFKESKKCTVAEARKLLLEEAEEELVDKETIATEALKRAEQSGIVFIDEIDKISGSSNSSQKGADVSREGVQRDLLPLVEGCSVTTKHGPVKTDHILFIASGAFHQAKPSDLMPEFQGRFPIRVELKSLTAEDFVRILTEPQNALVRQYIELMRTEGVELEFKDDAISEIASMTQEVNSRTEDIGARRLHTLLEKLIEEVSYAAEDYQGQKVVIGRQYVKDKLEGIVGDSDLARYIL